MNIERKRLFHVWNQMKKRCYDERNPGYPNYGGRGIGVCDRWLESFQAFLDDMGPRQPGDSLDRIDNDLGYGPANCRWADRKTQNSNRRNCIFVQDGDEQITLKEACRRRGLKYRPIVKRIRYRNWPIERALSEPLHTN